MVIFSGAQVYRLSIDQGCALYAAIYILGTVTVQRNLDRLSCQLLQLVFAQHLARRLLSAVLRCDHPDGHSKQSRVEFSLMNLASGIMPTALRQLGPRNQ